MAGDIHASLSKTIEIEKNISWALEKKRERNEQAFKIK